MTVEVFKGFQFFNQSLVLVLKDGNSVLQTLNILFLLPATFSGGLPVGRTRECSSHKRILVSVGGVIQVINKQQDGR